MDWWHSKQQRREAAREEAGDAPPPPVVRAAPGVSALFAGVKPDGSHAILDLGPSAEPHFRLYSHFARSIRFGDLLPRLPYGSTWHVADGALPPGPRQPYDLVLAWNLLDRLTPEERPRLVERVAQITAPGARLYVVVDASGARFSRPLRFTLVDLERVSQQIAGPPEPAGRELLPGDVERVLAPFEIVHAFTLRVGLREYVAVKRRNGSS